MRKEQHVRMPHEEGNRDSGKVYHLLEMPAAQAEKWAARAFLALAQSGTEIPGSISDLGYVGFAIMGFKSLMGANWEHVEPLLDEMMTCVSICPDERDTSLRRPATAEGDIEEVATRIFLRKEIVELHAGFTFADALSKSKAKAKASQDLQTTQTSLGSSES